MPARRRVLSPPAGQYTPGSGDRPSTDGGSSTLLRSVLTCTGVCRRVPASNGRLYPPCVHGGGLHLSTSTCACTSQRARPRGRGDMKRRAWAAAGPWAPCGGCGAATAAATALTWGARSDRPDAAGGTETQLVLGLKLHAAHAGAIRFDAKRRHQGAIRRLSNSAN